jgi:hypothetical protein
MLWARLQYTNGRTAEFGGNCTLWLSTPVGLLRQMTYLLAA